MNMLIFSMYQYPLAFSIAKYLQINVGSLTLRYFPDEEIYIKFNEALKNKVIVLIDSLEKPNQKILSLLFFAKTAKELGAKKIILLTPYLSYMRQDKRFKPGEGITSRYFADLLSNAFDNLLTVDPHLHRYHDLNEIYSIPTKVITSATSIAQWIINYMNEAILIGPDSESEQWVANIAKQTHSPYLILKKIRKSDKKVEINLPEISQYQNYTPVLIDDIISSGHTMLETIKQLKKFNTHPAVIIGVHAIFAENAYQTLLKSKITTIVTCNTISHASNQIDLTIPIAKALQQFIK